MTHYQRPTVTQLQEGGTGGEVSEILFFSAKSKRRPSLIYSMQIIPVCLSIVARRKGVSATRRGGLNWTPISLLVGHPCKLFHRGESKTEIRFYISSLADSAEKMARYIRDHWQVENCLHWVLDVTFRQDDCRIRKENAAANFTTINHAAINFLKRVPGKKMSMPQKRRSAALDDVYMESIIRQ